MKEGLLDTQVFTPAYQNPDRRGRARITRSYKDDQDEEGPVSNFPGSSSSKIGVPPVENAISTIVFLWWE